MDLKLLSGNGEKTATVAGSDTLFGREYNEALIHQVVVAYQANARQGTRAQKGRADINKSHKKPWAQKGTGRARAGNRKQKGRSEVAKSTRKPWRQKGTGRARAGMASSPLWRGGGKIFPSMPDENFSHKVNRKMYRAGIASILSQLVREDRLLVIESIALDSPKTKQFAEKIKAFGLTGTVLLVTDNLDDNTYLSSRNLPNVLVLETREVDPVSLVRCNNVLVTKNAVAKFEEMLG
jgi:large subunit ribosomal protein L4